jgi:hypothetical protein
MIQRVFKIQSILTSFIVNHVININLITLVHSVALIPAVATPNGMLPYYRLMTKWSGLGDSTELSRVGLSQRILLRYIDIHYEHV